jgi:hypothetical protein
VRIGPEKFDICPACGQATLKKKKYKLTNVVYSRDLAATLDKHGLDNITEFECTNEKCKVMFKE